MSDAPAMATEAVAMLATFRNPRRDSFFVDIFISCYESRPAKTGAFVSVAAASIATATENFIGRKLWN